MITHSALNIVTDQQVVILTSENIFFLMSHVVIVTFMSVQLRSVITLASLEQEEWGETWKTRQTSLVKVSSSLGNSWSI